MIVAKQRVRDDEDARPPRWSLMGIALLVTALTLGIHGLGILQLLEWAILDQWFRARPAESNVPPVVVVTIGDTDIAAGSQWPLTDENLAQLLVLLKQHNPTVIGLNLYRDHPIEPGSDTLHQIFATTPNLIGIEKVVGQGATIAIAPPPVLQAQDQVAFNDLVLDGDGHVRRHLLSLRHEEQTKFALGTRLALRYLNQQFGIVPEALEDNRMRLGKAEFSPLTRHAGAYVNLDVGGYQILANYLRVKGGIPTVSMQDVLGDRLPPNLLTNKIVVVGLKGDSSWGDRFYTPYSNQSDQTWAGTEIHANLAAQLIASARAGRSPLRTLAEPLEWGWILLWAGFGLFCNPVLSLKWRRLLRLPLSMGILVTLTYILFLSQYWVPVVTPFFALIGTWFLTQSYLIWHKLRQDNRLLENTVEKRTQELWQQNKELEKARVEAELANQAKSKFLAHITHELRTPLTAILGFGDLLERSPHLPHEERDYAETINRSGEHLLKLINNVLELSKIETGSVTLNPEAVYLPTFLINIRDMFQAQSANKQLSLNLDLTNIAPGWATVDSGKLRQVIINLVGNAVKFTQTGHVGICVSLFPAPADIQIKHLKDTHLSSLKQVSRPAQPGTTCILECAVEDTGPGLTTKEIKQLFQPFVQTTVGKNLQKGTGLGLALARQCVELMGGNINVKSTHGKGSCFYFYIPIDIPTPLPVRPSLTHNTIEQLPIADISHEYRVLIVDDEADNRRLISQWLTPSHFAIQTAETGKSALNIFEQWHPHLVLLDIHLPDHDGYEVARRIREQWASQLDANSQDSEAWLEEEEPVILAITAGVLQDNYADLLAAGCDDVIWKPLKVETLMNKISEYL